MRVLPNTFPWRWLAQWIDRPREERCAATFLTQGNKTGISLAAAANNNNNKEGMELVYSTRDSLKRTGVPYLLSLSSRIRPSSLHQHTLSSASHFVLSQSATHSFSEDLDDRFHFRHGLLSYKGIS